MNSLEDKMASITFEHVEKTYDDGNTIVPNFSLEIKEAEEIEELWKKGFGN